MTLGEVEINLQPDMSPPMGAMTLSMSAAVVPGAKLLATTQYGPAAPRMVISLSTGAKDRDLMLKEAGGGCCAAVWYAASLLVSAPPSD
jgi:hypothetical protein